MDAEGALGLAGLLADGANIGKGLLGLAAMGLLDGFNDGPVTNLIQPVPKLQAFRPAHGPKVALIKGPQLGHVALHPDELIHGLLANARLGLAWLTGQGLGPG